ncbi:MAG TPA: RodZ domain-containing protein [Anaerolineales bacterium]|nr:RodZ domain-containing protein [Anaerolineales bacterium]
MSDSAEAPEDEEDASGAQRGVTPRASIKEAARSWLTGIVSWLHFSPAVAKGVDHPAEAEEGSGSALPLANAVDFNPLPSEIDAEPESSDEIFAEIGRQLRARREMLSLTYEEIERHTHVRAAFLKGLEDGKLDGLPSPVQTRGILANYAAFIDLNADSIMLRFADAIQARHREQRPQWPPRKHSPMTVHSSLPPLRTFIASDLLFGGGAAIMLILFAVWGINRVVTLRSAESQSGGSPSIPEVLAQAPLPTVFSEITLIPAVDTPLAPTVEVTPEQVPTSIDPSITVQVKLFASERTYLRVTVDDKLTFEGRTEPGKDYYYQGARQSEVVVGNAAALRVTHNGTDRGTLGGLGQVVDQVYTSRGVFTPTPTTPPTATPSATPTATFKATPTLATFTATPNLGD